MLQFEVKAGGGPPAGFYRGKFLTVDTTEHEEYGQGLKFVFEVIEGDHKGEQATRITSSTPTPKNAAGRMLSGITGETWLRGRMSISLRSSARSTSPKSRLTSNGSRDEDQHRYASMEQVGSAAGSRSSRLAPPLNTGGSQYEKAGSVKAAALDLARRGWAVFPIKQRDKTRRRSTGSRTAAPIRRSSRGCLPDDQTTISALPPDRRAEYGSSTWRRRVSRTSTGSNGNTASCRRPSSRSPAAAVVITSLPTTEREVRNRTKIEGRSDRRKRRRRLCRRPSLDP